MEPQQILQRYWGHSNVRSLQEDIVRQVILGKDVVALLPTGGGKSLCFQIPALIRPGICIVVSPLVALMEDQVSALKEKGIKAIALTGGTHYSEVDTLLDNCIYGNYKFLYLSPERLQQELVQERIKQMEVNLVAVDEAHCISEWGHDFRPAYRSISLLRELQPTANMIALTATATAEVVKDIAEQLQLKDAEIFRKSFERKNIAYSVVRVEDKNYHLEKLLKEHQESAIIYVRNRKATTELAQLLQKKGISAGVYHGGLSKKEKTRSLKVWLAGDKRVMVATNAFGMGIDKADVRTVIHLQLPDSLESYFQEAGRAGRDEKPAKAVILTNESDIPKLNQQFLAALPDVDFVKLVYRKLVNYFRIAYGEGEGSRHSFNFAEFCQVYDLNFLKAYNSLQILDRTSVLQLSEQFQKRSTIQVLASNRQLQFYLEANPQYEDLLKAILRTYGGAFDGKIEIDLQIIESKSGIGITDAVRLLNQMKKEEILDFEHQQHDASVTFLVPREDDPTINKIAPYIKQQSKTRKLKIGSVMEYLKNDSRCRSQQLLEYFGEKKTRPCGICSVCKGKPAALTKEQARNIYQAIVAMLESGPVNSRELTEQLPFEEEHILKVLQLLVEKGALASPAPNQYKLKHL